MKNTILSLSALLISTLLFSTPAFAQFAKIIDADGYVNIRTEQSANSEIIGRLSSGEFVYIQENISYITGVNQNSPWVYSLPNLESEQTSGFIHNTRLERINLDDDSIFTKLAVIDVDVDNDVDNASHIIRFANNPVNNLANQNVIVTMQTEVFDYPANVHKFTEIHPPQSPQSTQFIAYEGKPFWGTDMTAPINSRQFKSITVRIGERVIDIPQSEFKNLFGIHYGYTDVYHNRNTDNVYISALQSDGAGGFMVLFAIENGMYVGKTVIRPC